ncbi:hypothetical protein MHH56_28115 [Paenibacillus sp. FSL K6-3182]|uniref:hypothetical protein n=1 Tax=Paenibacillus sp. FSL K6-3182 TaxID=2921495 RepID=UPI0030CE608E
MNLLFTNANFVDTIIVSLFYLFWVLFMVSFTTMISAIFISQGIIALISFSGTSALNSSKLLDQNAIDVLGNEIILLSSSTMTITINLFFTPLII